MNPSNETRRYERQLRSAAEAQLACALMTRNPGRSADELLHELQVHQIELELQNEALRTTQLALEQSRDRYVDLYEFAPLGYLSLTSDGLIARINHTGAKLLGGDRKRLRQKHFASFVADPEPDLLMRRLLSVQKSDAQVPLEVVLRRADGTLRNVRLDCRPAAAEARAVRGSLLGVRIAMTDISDQKRAEAELRDYREHLEQLVAARTAEVVEARAAEAASHAKSTFLAHMSHELRTPMTGIMGMIELASRRTTDPKTQDYLRKALDCAERLLSIIHDVLDFCRIEAPDVKLERRRFVLGGVLEQVRMRCEPVASAKDLALTFDIPADLAGMALIGDALRLTQILLHLVSNAIKFTPAGSVEVRALRVEESADAVRIRFEVADSGIGVATRDNLRIFEPFEQADESLTRIYGGTGLGLSISKRLVHLMDGEIGLSGVAGEAGEAGAGSLFWCTVRLDKAGPAGEPEQAGVAAEAASRSD